VGDRVGVRVGAFVGTLVGAGVAATRSIETLALDGVVLVTIEFTMMRNVLVEPLKFGIM
jgi:hypothetical protein